MHYNYIKLRTSVMNAHARHGDLTTLCQNAILLPLRKMARSAQKRMITTENEFLSEYY